MEAGMSHVNSHATYPMAPINRKVVAWPSGKNEAHRGSMDRDHSAPARAGPTPRVSEASDCATPLRDPRCDMGTELAQRTVADVNPQLPMLCLRHRRTTVAMWVDVGDCSRCRYGKAIMTGLHSMNCIRNTVSSCWRGQRRQAVGSAVRNTALYKSRTLHHTDAW